MYFYSGSLAFVADRGRLPRAKSNRCAVQRFVARELKECLSMRGEAESGELLLFRHDERIVKSIVCPDDGFS